MKTLWILLLICCSYTAKTQSLPPCVDSGLTVRYLNPGFQILMRNQNATANGGIIATGFRSDTILFRKIGFITKLNANKQTQWTLEIKPITDTTSIDIFDAKEFSDGSIVAVGVYSNERTLSKQAVVYKFTNTGQLIWEKKIDSVGLVYAGSNYLYFNSLNEGLNGDIVLSYNYSRNRFIDLMYTNVTMLDNSSQLIWQNNFSNTELIFENGEIVGKNINRICIGNVFLLNNSLFAIGCQEKNAIAIKFNYNNGIIEKSKFSKYQILNSSTQVASEIYYTTNLIKNRFLSFNTETETFTPQNEMFTFLFDTALAIVKQQRITVPGVVYNSNNSGRKNIITTTTDTTLISMPVDTAVYFISIDNQGKAIQERKIANANLSFGYYNKNLINGTSDALAVILSANPFNMPSGYELVQMQDFDLGITEYCVGTTEPHVNVQPYPLDTGNLSFRFMSNQGYKIVPFSSTITNLNFPKQTVCKVISSCDSIKILGADTVCTVNSPVYFKAYRNKDCIKRINWTLSNTTNAQLVLVNDSILKLTFTAEWSGYLYANINACRVFKDSIKINVFNPPSIINLGADTTFCTSTTVLLNAKKGFKNYRWQDGSTDSTFAATTSGQYYVTAYNYCNQVFTDTINLVINTTPAINLGNDTSVCSYPSFYLNAGANYKTYSWSTGATTQKIKVNAIGDYFVIATDSNNCKVSDTINITNLYQSPSINLNKKNVLCLQQNNFIDAGSGYINYLWQDGSNKQIITVNKIGKYKIIVSDANGCQAADSVTIKLLVQPPANFLFGDTTICQDAEIVLFANRVFNHYLWSNSTTLSTTKISNAAMYWLTVTDYYGCKGADTITVFNKYCDGIFYMPTAFTPNQDKVNDLLKPIINAPLVNFSFAIYNRFGQQLFSTNNITNGWNGLYNGQLQETGGYVWQCSYTIKNKPPQFKKGTVVLLR